MATPDLKTAQVLHFTREKRKRYYNTVELLDAIRARYNLASDAQLARVLDWSHSQVSAYRNRHRALSKKACAEVAYLLDLPIAYVFTEIRATRYAKDDEMHGYLREAAGILMSPIATARVDRELSARLGNPERREPANVVMLSTEDDANVHDR